YHLLRGGPMGKSLRDPRAAAARVGATPGEARQARDSRRRLEIPLGDRFSADELRRGGEALRGDAPSVHGAGAGGYPVSRFESEGGARAALRRRVERHGTRRRIDSHSPAGAAEKSL